MGYDDIRLYRPGKICGCLCVEVVLKWEHDQECNRGALVRKGRLGDADKTVVIDRTQGNLRHSVYVQHLPAVEHFFQGPGTNAVDRRI